jgi:hypothetical protein
MFGYRVATGCNDISNGAPPPGVPSTQMRPHGESDPGLGVAKHAGDFTVAPIDLTNGGEQLGLRRFRQRAAQDLDGVARFDGLRLLAIVERLDRHVGLGLQLEQLYHRPRRDLADRR